MKSVKKEALIKLRKALASSYREKEHAEVDGLWQGRVMGHIRSLGPLTPKTNFFEPFQRLVWRLTPVTCVLILLLGAALVQLDSVSDYELSNMFIEDPTDFSLVALYNG